MAMQSPLIQKLIAQFTKFPTVGPRTAARFVFHLIHQKNEVHALVETLEQLKNTVKICQRCFYPFEGEENFCSICANPGREKTRLCVVEKEADLESLEKIRAYRGLYFILGGTVSTLKKEDMEKLRIKELRERIENANPPVAEIILALNPTTDGEATTIYLEGILRPLGIKLSRLGRGLPIGGELEYADEGTLMSAMENRR